MQPLSTIDVALITSAILYPDEAYGPMVHEAAARTFAWLEQLVPGQAETGLLPPKHGVVMACTPNATLAALAEIAPHGVG